MSQFPESSPSTESSSSLPPAPVSELQRAMDAYRQAFGHGVPASVAMMFTNQPGPLLMEIRQAIALARPVPAWRAHSKRPVDPADRWTQVA